MDLTQLRNVSYQTLLDLSTNEGINASSTNEAYGCIFGRDSAITILKILKTNKTAAQPELLEISKRGLLTLIELQGRQVNIESGEEPGKFIHEFRRDKYERLINRPKPWFVYPDGMLRNYDSLDSTPLSLIALYRYWEATGDNAFLLKVLSSVEAGLNWLITYGDRDKDILVEYELPTERAHGGLVVQSWTDSQDSLKTKAGKFPLYPIAPIEAQGYTWLALKLWSDFYETTAPQFAKKLASHATELKHAFNDQFLFEDNDYLFGAQALDGDKNQIQTVTANPLLLLWATYEKNGQKEAIVEKDILQQFVARGFQEDLFNKYGGIRTMSSLSPTYNSTQTSYHNGSFWPMLNGMIHEGLLQWDFTQEAEKLKEATLLPISHFKSPIELYVLDSNNNYLEYQSPTGKLGCRYQAWSAAATLDLTTV